MNERAKQTYSSANWVKDRLWSRWVDKQEGHPFERERTGENLTGVFLGCTCTGSRDGLAYISQGNDERKGTTEPKKTTNGIIWKYPKEKVWSVLLVSPSRRNVWTVCKRVYTEEEERQSAVISTDCRHFWRVERGDVMILASNGRVFLPASEYFQSTECFDVKFKFPGLSRLTSGLVLKLVRKNRGRGPAGAGIAC